MKENEHYFKSDLAMILSRTTDDSLQVKLPRNLRLRDDQGFYISEACILHVYCPLREPYSATGTEDQPFRFPTLHNQVKGELVEVGPFVYLSLLHELENSNLSWDRVHSMWETCADFELHLQQSGRSGEVRKSIQEGLRTRDFDSLKQLAHDALTRRERGAFLAESRRTNSQTGCAAFILSLLSIPPLVAWSKDKLKIFKFPDENPWLLDVAGFVIAIAILAGALWCAMFLFKIFNSFWLKRWNKKNRVR